MILHIDPEKVWQGGQRQVAYLVNGLADSGVTPCLACRKDAPLHKFCQQNNWLHLPLDLHNKLNPQPIIQLVRFCRQNNIRLIHCHSSHALTLGLQTKTLLPYLKLVASRRVDFHINGRLSGFFKYNSPLLDKLICISQNIRNVCASDGIAPQKLETIYSGIELDRLASQQPPPDFISSLNLPQHDFLIGTIAALVHHKDYPTLIKAAGLTLQKHPRTLFLAFGKGPLLTDLKELTQELNISDRFLFMGFSQQIGWFLNSFDIFTLASKYEGLGTSVLDALACSRPCVCTNGGGIPEMISHEHNGLLVPARDHHKLAQALCRLIDNPSERDQYANAALHSVQKFDIANTVNAHKNLYSNLLNERL